MKKDWQVGITPTHEETLASVARARTYAQECAAILDELFPEDRQKPLTMPRPAWRQYQDRGEEIVVSDE